MYAVRTAGSYLYIRQIFVFEVTLYCLAAGTLASSSSVGDDTEEPHVPPLTFWTTLKEAPVHTEVDNFLKLGLTWPSWLERESPWTPVEGGGGDAPSLCPTPPPTALASDACSEAGYVPVVIWFLLHYPWNCRISAVNTCYIVFLMFFFLLIFIMQGPYIISCSDICYLCYFFISVAGRKL